MIAKFHFSSLPEVRQVAKEFVPLADNYKIIAFYGAMGVGKTTLIKDICAELGVTEVVNSPTFSLVNEYLTESGQTIYHFDFYRINDLSEAFDMGCDEYFYSGNLCLIEWPENIEPLLPPETLKITINLLEEERREVLIG